MGAVGHPQTAVDREGALVGVVEEAVPEAAADEPARGQDRADRADGVLRAGPLAQALQALQAGQVAAGPDLWPSGPNAECSVERGSWLQRLRAGFLTRLRPRRSFRSRRNRTHWGC